VKSVNFERKKEHGEERKKKKNPPCYALIIKTRNKPVTEHLLATSRPYFIADSSQWLLILIVNCKYWISSAACWSWCMEFSCCLPVAFVKLL